MAYSYEWPRAALTVDCVVFGLDEDDLKVMLIQRGLPPFEGRWALPGGFVRMDETLEQAARRELREETGLDDVWLEQLGGFDAIDRDPRERVITFAFTALVKLAGRAVHAATDARDAAWFAVSDPPPLAFDHDEILAAATARLRDKVRREPIGFELLPPRFTLGQLQRLYEIVLERPLDKRNFRKRVIALDVLEDSGEVQKDVAHRAARLYRFNRRRYEQLRKKGWTFEL
jgi:8-oxo-dGTP diphosphatase